MAPGEKAKARVTALPVMCGLIVTVTLTEKIAADCPFYGYWWERQCRDVTLLRLPPAEAEAAFLTLTRMRHPKRSGVSEYVSLEGFDE